MKKVSLLGCILALVLCLALDIYAAEHKKRLTFGYDFISGRLYYPEGKATYPSGWANAINDYTSFEIDQGEEAMALGQFSIRYSMLQQLKPINPNLFVGVEAGIGIPRTWSTSWDKDRLATGTAGTVENRLQYIDYHTYPSHLPKGLEADADGDTSYTQEYSVSISPLLAKLLYENPNGLTLDLGLGAYLVYVGYKEIKEYDYKDPEKYEKDYTYTNEYCITQVKPGIEGSIGYEFNPAGPISFSLEGRLMYVGKVRSLRTEEDYLLEVTGHGTADESYDFGDIKEGYEIGGLCYGLGVNLTLIY